MTRSILTFVCTFLAIVSVAEDTIPLKSKTTQPKQETAASLQPQPYISSLGVFGSSRVNETMLRQALGKELDTWLGKGLKGDETALQMELELAEKAKKKFDFAVADWTVMQFFEPTDLAIHVTLDVVEKADVSKRMPFKSAPKGEFKDPDGLLSSWRQYEEIALDLVEAGAITPDTEKCPAVHCPFGHSHKKLKPFEKIFSEGVKKNEKVLVEILNQNAQMDDRASAAYLLAYLNEPNKVSSLLIPAIKDSEPLVRNNVLRVLGDIAERNKDVVLPSKPFLEALEFPRSSDRSKAVFVVLMMSSGSQQVREDVLKSSVPALLAMLKGNQPDQRDFSHNILRKVSGKDFPVTDYLAWNTWYQKLSKERALTSGKPKESN